MGYGQRKKGIHDPAGLPNEKPKLVIEDKPAVEVKAKKKKRLFKKEDTSVESD